LNDYIENYCSYALIAPLNGNDITLVYNDNIRNLDPEKNKEISAIPGNHILPLFILMSRGTLPNMIYCIGKESLYIPNDPIL